METLVLRICLGAVDANEMVGRTHKLCLLVHLTIQGKLRSGPLEEHWETVEAFGTLAFTGQSIEYRSREVLLQLYKMLARSH